MAETYTCDNCGGVFEKDWSDAEALEEYKRDFGQAGDEPPARVCDDCYKAMIALFGKPLPS